MKWALSKQSLDHHKWLLQDSKEQAQFTYNLQHHSIRIKCKNNYRLFFLEVSGLFQKKILLRSEYGVIVGESLWTQEKEGVLLMNEQKYFFSYHHAGISLLDKQKNLLASFEIEHDASMSKTEHFALLFSSVWIHHYTNTNLKKTDDLLVA